MMQATAVAAISLALMIGYYWARWRQRENTIRVAKAALEGAGKQAWRARKAIFFTGIAVVAMIEYWFRSHGR